MTWALFHSTERGHALSLLKWPGSSGRTVKVLIVLTIPIRFTKRLGGSCSNLGKKRKKTYRLTNSIPFAYEFAQSDHNPFLEQHRKNMIQIFIAVWREKLAHETLENHLTASRYRVEVSCASMYQIGTYHNSNFSTKQTFFNDVWHNNVTYLEFPFFLIFWANWAASEEPPSRNWWVCKTKWRKKRVFSLSLPLENIFQIKFWFLT